MHHAALPLTTILQIVICNYASMSWQPIITNHISTECQKSPSPGGPPTGEWVLTNVADNTQLGNKDRIRDKGTL